MKKSIIPIIIGAVILIFATVLAIVTASTGKTAIKQARRLSQNYVNISIAALKHHNITKAILNAKAAIKADPSNSKGFACYENAISAQYKKAANPNTSAASSAPSSPAAAKPQLGC